MIEAIAVVGLFTFGICYLVRYTDGPLNMFARFRGKLGIRSLSVLDNNGNITDYIEESDDSFFAKLISCFWCFSTWISFAGTIIYFFIGHYTLLAFPFIWFGAVGISGTVHKFVEG